jgi:hypothetical protein
MRWVSLLRVTVLTRIEPLVATIATIGSRRQTISNAHRQITVAVMIQRTQASEMQFQITTAVVSA